MPWLRDVPIDRGALAGYARGRNRMQCVKMHRTYGRYAGDYSVGKQGYFQFYVPKVREAVQFAEYDALCWDSGEWNDAGPGIEFEGTNEEPLTANQIGWGARIVGQLIGLGIPATYYNGLRIAESAGYRGFIAHSSLIQSEPHGDLITQADWIRIVAAIEPPADAKDAGMVYVEVKADGSKDYWLPTAGGLVKLTGGEAYAHLMGNVPFVEYNSLGIISLAGRMKKVLRDAVTGVDTT